jgi:ferredoxin-type protein NapF
LVSRRQFLRGDFKSCRAPQRPPWALAEESFIDSCSRCGDCVPACPTKIIFIVRGFPQVDFKRGECSFCGACVTVCKDGALRRDGREAWSIKAQVADNCFSLRGVECRICGDHCPVSAIRFSPRLGGPPMVEIDTDTCTGCGACVAPCPVAALSVY